MASPWAVQGVAQSPSPISTSNPSASATPRQLTQPCPSAAPAQGLARGRRATGRVKAYSRGFRVSSWGKGKGASSPAVRGGEWGGGDVAAGRTQVTGEPRGGSPGSPAFPRTKALRPASLSLAAQRPGAGQKSGGSLSDKVEPPERVFYFNRQRSKTSKSPWAGDPPGPATKGCCGHQAFASPAPRCLAPHALLALQSCCTGQSGPCISEGQGPQHWGLADCMAVALQKAQAR